MLLLPAKKVVSIFSAYSKTLSHKFRFKTFHGITAVIGEFGRSERNSRDSV